MNYIGFEKDEQKILILISSSIKIELKTGL
jgi:hypothetical protein